MPNAKEVLRRISSIQDTMKITNAMYLISSSKLRTAKKNMEGVSDYFRTMQEVIRDILMHMPELKHRYFDNDVEHKNYEAKRAYVIITSDKGLAGSYNQAVIKHVEDKLSRYKNATLYIATETVTKNKEGTKVKTYDFEKPLEVIRADVQPNTLSEAELTLYGITEKKAAVKKVFFDNASYLKRGNRAKVVYDNGDIEIYFIEPVNRWRQHGEVLLIPVENEK